MHAVTRAYRPSFDESNQATIESKSNYDDLYEEKKRRRDFTNENRAHMVHQRIKMSIVIKIDSEMR